MFDRLIASKTSGTVSVLVHAGVCAAAVLATLRPQQVPRAATTAHRAPPDRRRRTLRSQGAVAWSQRSAGRPRRGRGAGWSLEPLRGRRSPSPPRRAAARVPGCAPAGRNHGNCGGPDRDRYAGPARAAIPGARELTRRLRGGRARIRAGRPVPAGAYARAGGAGARAPADQLHAQAASLTVEPPHPAVIVL